LDGKKAVLKKIEAPFSVRIQTPELFAEQVQEAGSGRNGRKWQGFRIFLALAH
jgi:biotin-(acetyl-CoA carboxylase) ligase